MDNAIYFPNDSGDRRLDLTDKVVGAATLMKNDAGDDLLVLEFVDGSSLRVKANFVSRDDNSDIDRVRL